MRLHVHEFGPGAGRTVVALHGVTGNASLFRRLAPELPAFRLLAPDLRGHGGSPGDPPWDLAVHLRDLRDTLDAAGVSRAPFIGFSFGGRLAMELLAADRSRIEKLVLLDPAIRIPPPRVAQLTTQLLEDVSWSGRDEAIAARSAADLAPYAPREHWEQWADTLVEGPDGRLRPAFVRPAAITIYSELATPPPPFETLRVPTLLITGSESELVTASQRERYAYELAEFLTIRTVRARHNVIADAVGDVGAAIAAFLAV